MLRSGARKGVAASARGAVWRGHVSFSLDMERQGAVGVPPITAATSGSCQGSKDRQLQSDIPLSGEEALDLIGVLQFALQVTMWQRQRRRMEELLCRAVVLFEGYGDVLPTELHASEASVYADEGYGSAHVEAPQELDDDHQTGMQASTLAPEERADGVVVTEQQRVDASGALRMPLQDPPLLGAAQTTNRFSATAPAPHLSSSTATAAAAVAAAAFPVHMLPFGVLVSLPVKQSVEMEGSFSRHHHHDSDRSSELALKLLQQHRVWLATAAAADALRRPPLLLLAAGCSYTASPTTTLLLSALPLTRIEQRNGEAATIAVTASAAVSAAGNRLHDVPVRVRPSAPVEMTRNTSSVTASRVSPVLAVRLFRRHFLECCLAGHSLNSTNLHVLLRSFVADSLPSSWPPSSTTVRGPWATIAKFERILCAELGWADAVSSVKTELRRQLSHQRASPQDAAASDKGAAAMSLRLPREEVSCRSPHELETALVHQCSMSARGLNSSSDDTHEAVAAHWLELESSHPHLAVGARALGALERHVRVRGSTATTSASPRWALVARQLHKHGVDADWLGCGSVTNVVHHERGTELAVPFRAHEPLPCSSKLHAHMETAKQRKNVSRNVAKENQIMVSNTGLSQHVAWQKEDRTLTREKRRRNL